MVKIRLKRFGKRKAPFYHIVVADSRKARDGKIIEQIGIYDPMVKPSKVILDQEKYEQWIKNGAKPTDSAKKLFEIATGQVKYVEKKQKKAAEPKAEKVEEKAEEKTEKVEEKVEETKEENKAEEVKEEPKEEKKEE